MSRQQRWQQEQHALGRCVVCAVRVESGNWRCPRHQVSAYRSFTKWRLKNKARYDHLRQRWIRKNRKRYLASQKNAYRRKRGLPLLPLPAMAE